MSVLRKRLLNASTGWELEPDEQNEENYDAEKQAEIASLFKMVTCVEASREDAT